MERYTARCWVSVTKPIERDGMFPMDVDLEVRPEGLSVSLDTGDVTGARPIVDPATIGMYHWLNSENNTEPTVIPYDAMEQVFGDLYAGNSYARSADGPLTSIPSGHEVRVRILCRNEARGTKLKVQLAVTGPDGQMMDEGSRALYNSLLAAAG